MTAPLPLPGLSAALVLRAAAPPSGVVTVRNDSPSEVRVWNPGNSWGDQALAFEAAASAGAPVFITRRLGFYTRNVPSPAVLAPGGRLEIPFDLGDGSWELDAARELLDQPDARIRGVYDTGDSPEGKAQGVHPLRLHTPFVPLHG